MPVAGREELNDRDRLRSICAGAVELHGLARTKYLDSECSTDTELRSEVERLLPHYDADWNLLDHAGWRFQTQGAPRFQAGDLLCGRFSIERMIGRGGMGEVYAAHDMELDERVALKTVFANLDQRGKERFRQEILMARRVTHPNVCRVFDLERTEGGAGVPFVTMEFIDGETLANLLRTEGPLLQEQAFEILTQVANGLDAAHEANVLHRDLKPANVMLTPRGAGCRAVITDFGLAKPVEPSQGAAALTHTGHVIGTVAYMAPELTAGGTASRASDIYALGVLMRDMCHGTETWRAAAFRCMHPEPDRRFATAAEVVAAVSGNKSRTAVQATLGLRVFQVALLAMALLLHGSRLPIRELVYREASPIVIASVANATGEPELDGVTELLRNQLSQSARLSLWDTGRLPVVVKAMRRKLSDKLDATAWREIANRENAGLVVFSNLSKLGDQYVFSTRVEKPARNPGVVDQSWDYTARANSRDQVFHLVREASSEIRKRAGESAADLQARDRVPQETTTASWEALGLYARGEQAKTENRQADAELLFEQAVAVDPDFALAHARLGDLLMSDRRQTESMRHWNTAIHLANGQRLTLREERRIRAVYANDSGDLAAAESALVLWKQDYPAEYLAPFYLGDIYRKLCRFPESLKSLTEAQRLQPDSYFVASSMARTYLLLKDFRGATSACARLRQLHRDEVADQLEGASRFLQEDKRGALLLFGRMLLSKDAVVRSRGRLLQARVEAELGNLSEAADLFAQGARVDLSEGLNAARAMKVVSLAVVMDEQGQKQKARALCLEAIQANSGMETLMYAATILARNGYLADASVALKRLELQGSDYRVTTLTQRVQGEILLAQGRQAEALQTMEKVSLLDSPLNSRTYLARAYAQAGEWDRAQLLYAQDLNKPAMNWLNAESALPGEQRLTLAASQSALQKLEANTQEVRGKQ